VGAIEKDRIDFSACKNFIKDWISISRAIHDKIVLFEVIEVEFVVFDHTLGHACLSVGGSPIDRDLRRLSSEKSTLSVKGVKYNEIIEKRNIPYIICIYIDFHAWFNKRELYRALYGFPHNKANALFYSSNQIMKNASGILLKQQDEYTYFHNFSNKRLNEDNIKFFSMWQYSMNED